MTAIPLLPLLLGASALFHTACDRPDAQPFRVGLLVWPPYEMGMLARELEYFDSSRIELVDYLSLAEVSQAFRNRTIDAMAVTLDYVLVAREKGMEPRIVLAIDRSHGGDAIMAKPGIETVEDLAGKRVGLESSALGPRVLKSALRSRDMDPAQLELVPIDMADQVRAFREGRVDAVVTYEPILGSDRSRM